MILELMLCGLVFPLFLLLGIRRTRTADYDSEIGL